MSKMTAEQCIDEMVRRIVRDFSPLQILLFGSQARDDANEHSDIDLIVVFPTLSDDVYGQTADVLGTLSGLGFSKDVIVTTPEEIERSKCLLGHVFSYAIPESKVLYDNTA